MGRLCCSEAGDIPKRKGSMAVEAVFVVPLVLAVVFLTLSYGFLEYQRTWFTAAAYEAVLTEGNEEQKADSRIREAAAGIGLPDSQASVEKDKAKVSYQGTALTLMGKYSLKYHAAGEVSRPDPVKYIRGVRLLGAALEGWKGGNDGG